MLAYLINLDRAPDRLAHMQGALAAIGCQSRRIVAVDGKALSQDELGAFRRASTRSPWTNLGAVGCFMSHRLAWKAIVEGEDKVALVIEDDLHLSPRLKAFLSDEAWLPEAADLVRLETTGEGMRLGRATVTHEGVGIHRLHSPAWGTGAYIIRRDVARWLLACPERYYRPADYFLFDQASSPMAQALATFQTLPALCVQDRCLPRLDGRRDFTSDTVTTNPKSPLGHMLDRAKDGLRPVARLLLGRRAVKFVDA